MDLSSENKERCDARKIKSPGSFALFRATPSYMLGDANRNGCCEKGDREPHDERVPRQDAA